jgi:hypothetical protein
MTEEEFQRKIAENKAKREKVNAKLKLAKEKREKETAENKLQYPDRSTFCQVLIKESSKSNNTSNVTIPHVKGTRRNGRCLDGSLDMTLVENKNKRKYVD